MGTFRKKQSSCMPWDISHLGEGKQGRQQEEAALAARFLGGMEERRPGTRAVGAVVLLCAP